MFVNMIFLKGYLCCLSFYIIIVLIFYMCGRIFFYMIRDDYKKLLNNEFGCFVCFVLEFLN